MLVVEVVELPRLMEAVDALFHRFGVLASQPWPLSIMDDQGSIEAAPAAAAAMSAGSYQQKQQMFQGESVVRLNRTCIRRFVNVFLVFHR